MNTRKLVVSALLVAMITVLTMFVKIPLSAFGYVHLGDTVIFLACYLLKPLFILMCSEKQKFNPREI